MVQLRVLKNRLFRRTLAVSTFATAGFMGTLFVVPLFLQEGRGVDAQTSGLTVFPEAIGVVTFTQVVASIYPRIGPRRLMSGGLVWVSLILIATSFVDFGTSLWVFRALMFLLGMGMACVFVSHQAASLATISRAETGRGSMLFSVQRQIGTATGVAVISSVLSIVGIEQVTSTGATMAEIGGYKAAFLVAAGLALIGALLAQRVPDEDAAITMRRAAQGFRFSVFGFRLEDRKSHNHRKALPVHRLFAYSSCRLFLMLACSPT